MVRIDVDASEVLARLERADDRVAAALRRASSETAEQIAATARTLVPVRQGLTRAGIAVRQQPTHTEVVSARQPSPNVPVWLEHGTRHMRARPYLSVAARLEEARFLARVEDALRMAVED